MATKTLRPFLNTFRPLIQRPNPHHHQQTRTFLSNFLPNPGPQTISASRTLPYPARVIYQTISDVASYSAFIPYCRSSRVTKTSAPTAADGKRYPEEAELQIGFNGGLSEAFWSRIYCAPERVVEAVAGQSETALSDEKVAHHSARGPVEGDPTRDERVLKRLATRWSLEPRGESTEVSLKVEFEFAEPRLAGVSAVMAPMVADKMIEAFEARVKDVAEGR